jgi:hypothetical protein
MIIVILNSQRIFNNQKIPVSQVVFWAAIAHGIGFGGRDCLRGEATLGGKRL